MCSTGASTRPGARQSRRSLRRLVRGQVGAAALADPLAPPRLSPRIFTKVGRWTPAHSVCPKSSGSWLLTRRTRSRRGSIRVAADLAFFFEVASRRAAICSRSGRCTHARSAERRTMSDKITLQDLSAEQEADRLLEEDEASRHNVLRDGLQQLEEEEHLPPPATQSQSATVSTRNRRRPSPDPSPYAAVGHRGGNRCRRGSCPLEGN